MPPREVTLTMVHGPCARTGAERGLSGRTGEGISWRPSPASQGSATHFGHESKGRRNSRELERGTPVPETVSEFFLYWAVLQDLKLGHSRRTGIVGRLLPLFGGISLQTTRSWARSRSSNTSSQYPSN